MFVHAADAIASGYRCSLETWKGIFILVKRHFNCIKVRQYVRISCLELTNCDCVKGGGDISGKQWQLPAAQATGVRTRPYLAHIHEPALISLVYEAVDDEPGLPVCLEIRCLNR